jgi:glycosyltransferase involved in cell wall biosynthesis
MIRILYLITGTNVGGTERTLFEICRRLDGRRHAPTVVSLKKEGPLAAAIREQGTEVLSLGMREEADWLSSLEFGFGLLRLPRLLKGRTFDILHSFLYRANIFGRIAAARCGIGKVVNSVRVTSEEESLLMRRLDVMTLRRADGFCALSPLLARDLRDRLAIPREKITVIPNAVDTAAADSALRLGRQEARASLGLSPADMVFLSLSRLHPQKGLFTLLEAFRPVALTHPRGRLLVAGEGPEREALEERARELGIGPQVTFPGPVSSPWPLLAAADVFVLPSLYEGMPNALLEAMAASLPVVATSVGAVTEMVDDGEEGIVVPPGDGQALAEALDKLSWSADLRHTMGGRGRRRVEESFRPEVMMEKLGSLYERILREDSPSP